MTSVFLSYARSDDEAFVRRLYADLTREGFTVWFDRESLMSRGLTFHQEIKDAIRTLVDRLIYIGGPKAATSAYVREEWQFALECDQVVVNPILRLGDYDNVPGELGLLHCEDFRNDAKYDESLAKLIRNLRQPNPPLGGLFGVPSLPPNFLGRPDLMRRVCDALRVDLQNGPNARVGVLGMGGIGKSVFAAALARNRQVREAYPNGVVWISCGKNVADEDLLKRQRDLARHLGGDCTFVSLVQGQGVLRQLLANKAVLLVLDDVWRADDAVRPFDVLGPRCRMLITTRDKRILDSLHGESVPVSLFTESESLQLLADAVGIAASELPGEAREVVRECGCLPLALALCGGMARKRGGDFHSVLERLRRADLEKIADRESINEQHRSIWRAMQASVEMLSADAQQRFAELSVFATDETVPEAAAATLWFHTGNLNDLDAEDLLIDFSDRSLVQLDQKREADGTVRRMFRLHDLLYDYTVRISGEPQILHEKTVEAHRRKYPNGWYSNPRDVYWTKYLPFHLAGAGNWLELLDIIRNPSLGYLSRWIDQGEGAVGLKCISGLVDFLENGRSNLVDAAGLATQAARICAIHGRYDEARNWLEQHALPNTSWGSGRRVKAIALHETASLYLYEGKYEKAKEFYLKANRMCGWGILGLRDESAANLTGLATVYQAQARFRASITMTKKALRKARLAGDAPHEVAAYRLLGTAYLNLGMYTKADQTVRLAIRLCDERHVRLEMPRLKLLQGWLAFDQIKLHGGELSEAISYFEEAMRIAQTLCNLYCVLESKMGLGWCELERGNTSEARACFQEVSTAFAPGKFPSLLAGTKIGLAAVFHQEGLIDDAVKLYEAEVPFCREQQLFYWESKALVGIGALHWHRGKRELAISAWSNALRAARKKSAATQTLIQRGIACCKLSPNIVP